MKKSTRLIIAAFMILAAMVIGSYIMSYAIALITGKQNLEMPLMLLFIGYAFYQTILSILKTVSDRDSNGT